MGSPGVAKWRQPPRATNGSRERAANTTTTLKKTETTHKARRPPLTNTVEAFRGDENIKSPGGDVRGLFGAIIP